jgi:hypothetical protein
MLKLYLVVLALINLVYSQCPFPFTDSHKGYYFNNCYYYAGVANDYDSAVGICSSRGTNLVMAKDQSSLDDLYPLYKAYTNYYFWVIFSN